MNVFVRAATPDRTDVKVRARYLVTTSVQPTDSCSFNTAGLHTAVVANRAEGTPPTRTLHPTHRGERAIIEAIDRARALLDDVRLDQIVPDPHPEPADRRVRREGEVELSIAISNWTPSCHLKWDPAAFPWKGSRRGSCSLPGLGRASRHNRPFAPPARPSSLNAFAPLPARIREPATLIAGQGSPARSPDQPNSRWPAQRTGAAVRPYLIMAHEGGSR